MNIDMDQLYAQAPFAGDARFDLSPNVDWGDYGPLRDFRQSMGVSTSTGIQTMAATSAPASTAPRLSTPMVLGGIALAFLLLR